MILEEMKREMYEVLCYTRLPQDEDYYAPKLAHSMHLAFSEEGVRFSELNHNSGVLFAKATENIDGTLNAKSLKKPFVFYISESLFGVLAIRTEADGSDDKESKGQVLLFTSTDLLQYEEVGFIHLKADTYVQDLECTYNTVEKAFIIRWMDENGKAFQNRIEKIAELTEVSAPEECQPFSIRTVETDIEGIVPRNVIQISKKIAHRLYCKLMTPSNTKIVVPAQVTANSLEELNRVMAVAEYSDGTTAAKKIDWDTAKIDWKISGEYTISGKIHQDHYQFPIAYDRADPCIGKWGGKYYFIATNDADRNHSLYIREAENIPDLVHAKEYKILDTTMYEHLGNLLWAPEFHIIGDELFIFHAGSPKEFHQERCHVMQLKKGGNPVNAGDWNMPNIVLKKDGSPLFESGITLDMTCFKHQDRHYVIWAQRQFQPVDQGSWLYIASINPEEPWKLVTDPVLISKPDYGWANNRIFVDEGPYPLITDQKILITFASALIDSTYVVGILSIEKDVDLLDANNWIKGNYPILTSRSVLGEFGPGHNSYVTDDHGIVWNAYHARPGIGEPRSSGIRRVHFDIDGYPVLDLTEDQDLNQDLSEVSIIVHVGDEMNY